MNRASSATGWVRNPDGTLGWTWNPLTGCLNHTSDGLCLGGMFPCYAYRLANGRLKARYLYETTSRDNVQTYGYGCCLPPNSPMSAYNDPFYPRFWPERLIDPITDVSWSQRRRWGKRASEKGIFVCDMGELFGDWIPRHWQDEVFETIRKCPQHRFYLLTKQPQNLPQWSPFPPNCYVGVTATNSSMAIQATHYLGRIEAKVKYLSYEPLLDSAMVGYRPLWWAEQYQRKGIDWVIIGAQTKPYKPPEIEWVQEIHDAADKAGIPIFIKDNLLPLFKTEMGYLNKDWLRQEMPIEHGVKEV